MNSRTRNRKDRCTLQRAERGNNHHCCVPLCSAGGRFNTVISFHCFPKDPELRAHWLRRIRRDFAVTSSSRVCSRHFETGQILRSSSGKRCLQPRAVPSLFHWNHFTNSTERPSVWDRPRPVQTVAMAMENTGDPPSSGSSGAASTPDSVPLIEDHDYAAGPLILVDRTKYETMSREIEELRRHHHHHHQSTR